MSEDPTTPFARLLEETRSDDEQAAARLLAPLATLPPRSPATHARTRAEVERRLEGRRRGFMLYGPAIAGVAVLVVLWVGRTRPPRHEPLRAEVGQRVSLPEEPAIVVVGPAIVTGDASALHVERGTVEVAPRAHACTLTLPTARVTVPPNARATITVAERHLHVAAYAGVVAVRIADRVVELAPGEAYDGDGEAPRPAPDDAQRTPAPATPKAERTDDVAPRERTPRKHAPEVRPADAPAQPEPEQPSPPTASRLAAETALLRDALKSTAAGDPAGALRVLDDHDRTYPDGTLAVEAARARVDALLALHRKKEALAILESSSLTRVSPELQVIRGELRAEAGRAREACEDFAATLLRVSGPLAERALFGQAACRAKIGDADGARESLESYLARFPNGRFASEARRALDP